ncbi:MAG: hypothetical protein GF364_16610 [Candidatus Lokiarchaeota archaeon]|nr:hypothetical protein [Candidatus Lokiarchaeota archaeon]
MEKKPERWNYVNYMKTTPAFIIAGIIFYFSSLSHPLPPGSGEGTIPIDITTLLHIAEYAALSFFLTFGFNKKIKSQFIILIGVLYAISDEIHQYFVPYRYFDVFDILLDTIGVLLGLVGFLITYKIAVSLISKIKKNTSQVNLDTLQ